MLVLLEQWAVRGRVKVTVNWTDVIGVRERCSGAGHELPQPVKTVSTSSIRCRVPLARDLWHPRGEGVLIEREVGGGGL